MNLNIECSDHPHQTTVVSVEGEITFENADQFRDKFNELNASGKNRVIVDLAKLKYMSSAGMGVLVHGLKIFRQGKGDLRLVNLSPKMRQVFLITQFTHHFAVFPSLDEAITGFALKQE